MRILSLIITLSVFLSATEYFAKLKPLHIYNVKAAVGGQVVYINDNIEGAMASDNIIVKLDSSIDVIDLQQTNNKIKTTKQIITIEQKTYDKFQKIRSKSQLDKDSQKIKILNLQNQQSDLITKKATLEDKIANKNLKETKKYISSINVEVGDYVNMGTHLYTANDLTKAKLEIFVPISSASEYKNKIIYIDGKQTQYTIYKLYKVADTKHISSYKCEIIIDAPKDFSKLVKIEFK